MISVNEKDIDKITETFYRVLKGETPSLIQLPDDYPDNEIRQLTEYVNRFLTEYNKATDLVYTLSKGELDFNAPKGKTLFLHSLKNLQSNLKHLTWKTQQIARGDFTHEVDFMGDFSEAFNTMVKKLKESFDALKKSEAETRELMADIQAAKLEAEAATRAKSQFLANMSHEIRTPLNSVLGFLELALEGDLTEFNRNNLNTAYQSAKSLLSLINDILDISKLESGRMELDASPFDIRRVVGESLRIFHMKALEKGIRISFDAHPDLPDHFMGDSVRLRQIILNLVGNAIKFTECGAITLSVKPHGEIAADGLRTLHFSVSDTGIGIPADRLEKIFEPFVQADNSTARRFGGTGLGTTISKKIVELMGGQIWAESEEGRGSVFHFTLRIPETQRKPECGPPKIPHDGHSPSRRRFRILLAEDIEDNIALMRIRLERVGHTVIVARNGLEAVRMFLGDKDIDAVLMDVHMPEMDGLEATRKMREVENHNVPIIALTASVMNEEREACAKAGMDAIVGKPVDFGELFAVLERLVPECGESGPVNGENQNNTHGAMPKIRRLPGIDIKKGLHTWQDSEAYADALVRFSRDYRDAADALAHNLECGDTDAARELAHNLKGVSGNLSVTDVFVLAGKINDAVATGKTDDAKAMMPDLKRALDIFLISVRGLGRETKQEKEKPPEKEFDPIRLKKLFHDMLTAIDQYNPSEVAPFFSELLEYLPSRQVDPIQNHVAEFKFKNAREETIALAKALEIDFAPTCPVPGQKY